MSIQNIIKELTDNGVMFDIKKYEEIEIVRMKSELDNYLSALSDKLGQTLYLENLILIYQLLKDKGVFVRDLSQEYLKKHQYDCEELYLLYKAKDIQQKLRTYSVDKLKSRMDNNGRIHGEWYRANATTGRLICRNPALQGLPSSVRNDYMIAEKGYSILSADYATIELRVLAKLSGDRVLISDLIDGKDIHKLTASSIFSKPLSEISETERQIAKSVNFMICYGGSAYGLSKKLSMETNRKFTVSEAQKMINRFYNRYTQLYLYHQKILNGYMKPITLEGRIFDGLTGAKSINYPCQASAAEGFIKMLNYLVDTKPVEYKLIMTIHDSVSVEVPKNKMAEAENYLKTTTERCMGEFLYPIPAPVEIKKYI